MQESNCQKTSMEDWWQTWDPYEPAYRRSWAWSQIPPTPHAPSHVRQDAPRSGTAST